MLFWIVATILCVGAVAPQVAQADAICKSQGTYNTYYPGDCDKYYKCENGQATEESCGWFYRFDENSSECKFHAWFIGSVNCSEATPNKPTVAPTGKTTKGTTLTPKTGNPTTSPTKPTSKTSSTATTPNNGPTTKKSNGAGSTKFSILLTAICILSVSSRHLLY